MFWPVIFTLTQVALQKQEADMSLSQTTEQFIRDIAAVVAGHDTTNAAIDGLNAILPFSRATCEGLVHDVMLQSDDLKYNADQISNDQEDPMWSEKELDDIEQHFTNRADDQRYRICFAFIFRIFNNSIVAHRLNGFSGEMMLILVNSERMNQHKLIAWECC